MWATVSGNSKALRQDLSVAIPALISNHLANSNSVTHIFWRGIIWFLIFDV